MTYATPMAAEESPRQSYERARRDLAAPRNPGELGRLNQLIADLDNAIQKHSEVIGPMLRSPRPTPTTDEVSPDPESQFEGILNELGRRIGDLKGLTERVVL